MGVFELFITFVSENMKIKSKNEKENFEIDIKQGLKILLFEMSHNFDDDQLFRRKH